MRIQAAVLRQPGLPPPYTDSKPLEITELDLAPPGRGEVQVKMAARARDENEKLAARIAALEAKLNEPRL